MHRARRVDSFRTPDHVGESLPRGKPRLFLLKGISAHRARRVDLNLHLPMVHNRSLSGRPKLSEEEFKWLVSQCNSRAELRRRSGLSRWTISRMADRYGVDLATAFDHSATQLQSTSGHAKQSPQAVECAAVAAPVDRPKPELKRNILRLSAADFAGVCLGESSHATRKLGSPDELLNRYRRLQG